MERPLPLVEDGVHICRCCKIDMSSMVESRVYCSDCSVQLAKLRAQRRSIDSKMSKGIQGLESKLAELDALIAVKQNT